MKKLETFKILVPTIMLVLAIIYSLAIGNQITDSVEWNSMNAHASSDNMEQWEDYSESLPDYLQFDFSAPTNSDWRLPEKTFFTSYNPEKGQTDASPCIGASGRDQCVLAKQGIRIIALSQDMVGRAEWKKYHYGETVRLYSDNPQCEGEFLVLDTMNKRYTNRGDLFQLTRATNTSCWVTVVKI